VLVIDQLSAAMCCHVGSTALPAVAEDALCTCVTSFNDCNTGPRDPVTLATANSL
jgi:hypothetical protein